jgi:hypothetical protein
LRIAPRSGALRGGVTGMLAGLAAIAAAAAVAAGALCAPPAWAADADPDAILVHFNTGAGQWAPVAEGLEDPGGDLEGELEKGQGKLLTVRIDLNGDGMPEQFLRTLCGNGGCEYPIFDGRSRAFLGSVFGAEIWVLRRRAHALPVIESYSHLAATRGTVARYEFDGARYGLVSSREIGDEETQTLYKRLGAAPRIGPQ